MTASASAPADAPVVLGLLRTAGLELALPLSVLREVVPCPAVLEPLPVDRTGLLGALVLRGATVPVLDAAALVGREHPRRPGQVVVVLVQHGRLLGLLADEVRGLASVHPSQTTRLAAEGTDLLCSHTFPHPEQGHVVSLLDPEVVLRLPGVPVVLEVVDGGAGVRAGRPPTRSLTVVRCGAHLLAIGVEHVHSTTPAPVLSPSVVDGPTCLGVTPVAGADVAVADLLSLLGLGDLAGTAMACGLVLDLPDGQVVLGVTEMVGLHDVEQERIVALPAAASPDPRVLTQVADVDGVGACLVVDGEQLRASAAVLALSRVATVSADAAGGPEGDAARSRAGTGAPHLAYRAGVDVATPLGQVVEVLGFPDDLVRSSGSPAVLGIVVHRGSAVPVLCLATVLEREAPAYGATSRLLLVHVDGAPVAWAVESLHAILALSWHDTDASGSRASRAGGVLSSCALVQLDAMPALLPVVELEDLARATTRPLVDALPAQRSPSPPVRQPA